MLVNFRNLLEASTRPINTRQEFELYYLAAFRRLRITV